MANLQRIDDLTSEPVVGEYYHVPTVKVRGKVFPILGEAHSDIELGVSKQHWHFDARFLTSAHLKYFGYEHWGWLNVVGRVQSIVFDDGTALEVEYRRLKCKRRMPVFPPTTGGRKLHGVLKTLEAMYAKAHVVERHGCRRCPHRGFKLDTLPQGPDGSVVCPGHGLRWDMKTGEMVTREYEAMFWEGGAHGG